MNKDIKSARGKAKRELRQQAEALLKGQPANIKDLSHNEIQDLLYELEVHQVELSMQNESLREAQDKLAISNDRYTDLFDFSPSGYFICDTQGLILEANLTGCQLLEADRAQVIGKPFSKFVSKESQDSYFLYHQKTSKSAKPDFCKLKLKRKNNSTFAAQLESITTRDPENGLEQCRISVTEILEVKHAEALQENVSLLRLLVAAATEGILLLDGSYKIRMCNHAIEKLFGYTEDELLGEPVEILIPKPLWSTNIRYLKKVRHQSTTRPIEQNELFGIKKGGERFPIEMKLNSLALHYKQIVTVFISDISLQKKQESDLRKEKQTAQLYLDLANAIFLVLHSDEKISLINQKGCEILGYHEDEILDKNWFDQFIPDDRREEAKAVFHDIMQGRITAPEISEGEIMVKSKHRRTVEWHHAALTDVTGRTIGVISSGIDITGSRRRKVDLINALHKGQEQERKRISKELHDGLGQQLAAAKMLLGAFETDLGNLGKENQKLYYNALITLDGAIKEARNIAHNLVPYLLEGKGLVPAIEQLCKNISPNEILQFKFRHWGMKARVNPQVEIGIFRVLQELISNIMKHAHASQVDIMLKQHKNKIILEVEDNGIGFQGSFEEMQLNGIGLRNITSRVKGLRGKITLDSSEKQGTAVIIEIPTGKN